ncbi:MAG: S1C family serine protease [Burkholderiaceae bacterium]
MRSHLLQHRLPQLGLVLLVVLLGLAPAARAQDKAELEAQSRALQRASNAVLGVKAQAVEEARSSRTLGREREGSGVVIDAQGLVLTIGYLILEAEQVLLVTDDDREIPGRVVGYDIATGFGLVQPLVPLRIEPAPLGESARVRDDEPLMIASGGEGGAVSVARLVSRRPFAGYWEYHIEGALFTAPARRDHSGAGLFNGRGELVGVGSLYVQNARGSEQPRVQGNMFVPVDLLRPVLDELKRSGTTAASRRAWLGISCSEEDGQLRIIRVSDDSPADVAGLQEGDRILRIDGKQVSALDQLWLTLWRGGAAEREVTLEVQRRDRTETFKVYSVDRAKTLKRSQGV